MIENLIDRLESCDLDDSDELELLGHDLQTLGACLVVKALAMQVRERREMMLDDAINDAGRDDRLPGVLLAMLDTREGF